MKKTVSLLLVAIMLLGVSSAMAIPGQPAVGSHQSLGDQGGVRSAVIDAANWHGIIIDQPAIDALGLKFSAKGRFTDKVTKYGGFEWRWGEDSDKNRAANVPGIISYDNVAGASLFNTLMAWSLKNITPNNGKYDVAQVLARYQALVVGCPANIVAENLPTTLPTEVTAKELATLLSKITFSYVDPNTGDKRPLTFKELQDSLKAIKANNV